MNDVNILDKRLTFFKEKIKTQLLKIKEDLGPMRYKLYVAMVEECDNYDELRDMAELEMQIDTIEYNREIKAKLTENNTDIKELKLVCDENYKNQVELEVTEGKEINKPDIDIAEELQDDDTSAAMALILMQRLATEPLEETYRDEIDGAFDKKPELSDLDSITDEEIEGDYNTPKGEGVELIDELDIDENSLIEAVGTGEESENKEDELDIDEESLFDELGDTEEDNEDNNDDTIEIDEESLFDEGLFGDDEVEDKTEKVGNNNNEDNEDSEFDIAMKDIFGDDDDEDEKDKESDSDEFDIDEKDLFDDSDEDDEDKDEFDIDEKDLFDDSEEEDEDKDEFDIDENDIFGDDDEDDEDKKDSNIDDIEIDESELFDEDEDEDTKDKSDGIDDIEIDEEDGSLFEEDEDESKGNGIDDIEIDEEDGSLFEDDEEEEGDGIDNIEIDEEDGSLFEDDKEEEETNSDPFSGINDEDFGDLEEDEEEKDKDEDLFEDDLGDLGIDDEEEEPIKPQIKPTTPVNKQPQTGNNTNKRPVTPQTVLNNGTERGDKSQKMFNWLHNTFNKTGKAIETTSVKAQHTVKSNIEKAKKSDFFKIEKDNGDDDIDF